MSARVKLLLVGMVLFATLVSGAGCTTVVPHSVVVTQTNENIGLADAEVFVERAEACSSSVLIFPSTGDASLFAAMEKLKHENTGHKLAYITTDISSTWALFTTTRCTIVRAHYVKGSPSNSMELIGDDTESESRDGWVENSQAEPEPEPEQKSESQADTESIESRIRAERLANHPDTLSDNGIALGTPVRVRTKSGRTADGIFKSFRNEQLVILVTADAELKLNVGEIDWLAKVAAAD